MKIEPVSETESSRRERLLEQVEEDIRLLPESASPESVEEDRERYLAREAKRKRPSNRILQRYLLVGLVLAGLFGAMVVIFVGRLSHAGANRMRRLVSGLASLVTGRS